MSKIKNETLNKGKKVSRKQLASMERGDVLKLTIEVYSRLMTYIKPYKIRFYLGILFGVLYGMFNGLMFFFIELIMNIALPGKKQPVNFPGMKFLQDLGVDLSLLTNIETEGKASLVLVVYCAAAVPFLFLIRGGLQYLSNYCMLWVSTKVLYDLRSAIFSNLLNQSQEFYNSQKSGILIQTVFNQTRMAANSSISMLMNLIKHPISILSIVGFLIYKDWVFALFALVLFPLSILPVIIVSQKVRRSGGKEEEMSGNLIVNMQESFSGIRVVKSHAREDYELKRFNLSNKAMANFIMRWRKAMEIVGPLMETVASIGIATGFIYAWVVDMSPVRFFVLYLSLIALYPHAKALSRINIMLQKCLVAVTTVFKFIDRKPKIADIPNPIELKKIKGEIKFKDVTFAYQKNEKENFEPAVKKINFTFEAGKSYALVGSTGAGKSTLFSLLLRFYDVDEGSISLDGINIKNIRQHDLRDNIGLVNQDVFLFNDTIYQNILYGKLDATKEEIINASKHAHAHEFIIDEKTGGYKSTIGESGSKLSGGQKQRITIARAVLRNAPILLLDEATSAIDSETELKIKDALDELSEGKTTIAIAHRLSTILNADKIIYLENGEIKHVGSHHELMKISEKYRNIYNLQFAAAKNMSQEDN